MPKTKITDEEARTANMGLAKVGLRENDQLFVILWGFLL
jgi:hypothetical protein